MRKKGFTLVELLAVIVVLGIIAGIAIPTVTSSMKKAKNKAYDEQVNQIEDNAKRWAVDHNEELPAVGSTNSIAVKVDDLIKGGYISKTKDGVLYDPRDNKKTMDGCVLIGYSNEYNQYTYQYEQPCSIKDLAETLLAQYNESNTVGLLKDDTGYYYKGTNTEVSNNFVWWGGHLWRVVSIDNDNNLTMITQQPLTSIQPASAVWTTQAEYEASYINHWINSEEDGVFYKSLTQEDKTKIQNSTFNVGIYTNVSEITTTQKIGLLDETQYTKAGGQNSFLDIKDVWLLGNRYSASDVRSVYHHGGLENNYSTSTYGIRPVVKIPNLTFTAGTGTLDDPYRDSGTTTNTSNIKVGEYVSIPTSGDDCGTDKRCLFRVVSKDNNSIKVILNGLLPSTSATTVTYTSGSAIDNIVTTFAGTINANYRYSGTDKTFGIGTYPATGTNYTAVQTPTYAGTAGLPVVGEMFTANDIDMTTGSTAKTFVNVNTIENSTVSVFLWTMNANSTSRVRNVSGSGSLDSLPAKTCGVRPVLFLKNNLTFTSGEGTAEHPFTLE